LKDMDLQEGESPGTVDMENLDAEKEEELQRILDEERKTPMFNVNLLVGLFVVILAMNLLKGGGAFPSPIGIKCGTTVFWCVNGIMLGIIFLFCAFVRSYLVERFEAKKRCGYKYVLGDIQWDGRATIVYPSICCLAGFFAGMFGKLPYLETCPTAILLISLAYIYLFSTFSGVGGGIVKGPLMLAMEVHPKVGV
jgi:hypothetical protein